MLLHFPCHVLIKTILTIAKMYSETPRNIWKLFIYLYAEIPMDCAPQVTNCIKSTFCKATEAMTTNTLLTTLCMPNNNK